MPPMTPGPEGPQGPQAPATSPGVDGSKRQARALAWTVVSAVVLVNALVCGFLVRNLESSQHQARERARLTSQNLALLLAQSLDAVFDKVDQALLAVVEEQERQAKAGIADPAALAAVLARYKSLTPDLLSLRTTDSAGEVGQGLPPTDERATISDRPWFSKHRQDAHAGLLISKPYLGRIIKVPLIVCARRRSAPDGSFAGTVFGSLSLKHISRLLSVVGGLGPKGVIVLRDADLSAVVRRLGDSGDITMVDLPTTPQLHQLIEAGKISGSYDAVAPADGVERSYSFGKVSDRALYVVVGLSIEELLESWRREAAQAAAMAALFALVTTLAAWFALRSFRRLQAVTAALARDVGERQRAEVSLRESEGRLAAAFAAFPDAVAISDLNTGRYLLINQGFTAATGWPAAEALGKTSVELGLWVDKADRTVLTTAISQRGAIDNYEAPFWRRDRTQITGLTSGRVVTIDGKHFMLTITRDITGQKALEAQLGQAQRLESVGLLAGGVAHDFNNMLLVILGEAAILEESLPPDHPGHESVREIIQGAERSRDLTRQLLAFSRKQVISPSVVDLNSMVGGTRQTLARLIGEEIRLVFEPGPGLWAVRLDRGQFDQVLMNLVVNAREAMPSGGTLSVRTANVTVDSARANALTGLSPGDYVTLAVSDDGVGMSAETLTHIFEPFFTTKEAGKGTGLGLATTYGIVKQNGGGIFAESVAGSGSTFTLYLPRADAEVDLPTPLPRRAPVRGDAIILLVEDEAPVRRTTRKMLESLGYTVREAGSGAEALALAAAQDTRIDLLATDVVMPGMRGPELCQRLALLRPGLRTVLMSGYAASTTGNHSIGNHGVLEAGVRFLQKPFSLDELARKVHEALADGAR